MAPGFCRRLALIAFALVLPASSCAAEADCLLDVLGRLGWRIEAAAGGEFDVHPGTPCDRADLADAHAHGDLQLRIDRGDPPPDLAEHLRDLLAHPATLCAYSIAVGEATRRATEKLAANRGYRFSALQAGWIGFGMRGARAAGWQPTASFGRAFEPLDDPQRAIEHFYTGRVRSECGVGRQIAQYATFAELFTAHAGDGAFARAFAGDEIVIGRFTRLQRSNSVLLGAAAGELERDGLAVQASARGRQAFSGLPGFIVHVYPRHTLDDINNQAQNFVVHDVDAAAAESLRRHGGFAHFNALADAAWALTRTRPPPRGGWERLLVSGDEAALARLDDATRAHVQAVDAALSDPFFTGFRVYVHPLGVRSVRAHLLRLFDRNPRTPFRVELGMHNVTTTIFERYVASALVECVRRDASAAR